MDTRRSFVALWIALLFAGSILAFVTREAGPLPGDLVLTRWLQEWLPPDGLIALLGRRWFDALFVLVAAVTGLLLGDALKLLVARARPSVELVRVYEPSGGYGFPSTTALLSVVLLGTVCYLVGQERSRGPLVAVMVCVSLLLALAIGISRIDVGEHWATDILGGWLFGSAWLLVLISIHRRWSSMQGRPRTAR
jgi:undecaprenyl-diphosphatase